MIWKCAAVVLSGMTGLINAPVRAEVSLEAADACLATQTEAGQSPAPCIDAAHADCQLTPSDAPALATLCFTQARRAWGAGITAEMNRIRAIAPEKIAAIAAIETKYDLVASLTQCDRMEELARAASNDSGETIQRQKARCAAAAAGLAYLRLKYRARDLE